MAERPAPTVTVREMSAADWPAVASIYAEGIATGDATFETSVPSWEAWDDEHLPGHRLVAVAGDRVVGWAALALHERAGFPVVGVRERLGRMDGTWRDVVMLERRSPPIV